jgi:hypothetical protein
MAYLGVAPDAVRDQIMRHDPFTGVFNGAYLNHRVRFNVQDAFLENDVSDDGLTRAFTHMSIRCNPDVPKEIPKEVLDALPPDPEIVDLEIRHRKLWIKLRFEYRFVKRAPKKAQKEYQDLGRELANARKSLKDEIYREFKKDYRYRFHNEMMRRQLNQNETVAEEYVEPVVEHQLEERTRLQKILCDFSTDLSVRDIINRKIRAINLMVALASRQEVRGRKQRSSQAFKDVPKEESLDDPILKDKEFPLICKKTQCIICIGNERLSYRERTRTFKRASHMMDQVEKVHLKHEPAIFCHHPVCKSSGLVLSNLMHFKNHVAKVHGITLRA